METSNRIANAARTVPENMIDITELAERLRWRRYLLATAAANPYLERPTYAA